jgi:hypothetical protein
MNRLLVVAAATICLGLSFAVKAQTGAPGAQTTQPPQSSPEKQALVKELSEAMGVKKQAAEMFTTIEKEMSRKVVELTWESLSAMPEMKSLTDAERQELKQKLDDDSAKQYQQMIDAITRKVDLGQLLEEVSMVVYSKNFNEKELRDLIAFYKSDTGRRSMELASKLMVDSMSETTDRLMPIMNDVMRDIANAGTNKYRDQVTTMARAHHRQTTTKRKPR